MEATKLFLAICISQVMYSTIYRYFSQYVTTPDYLTAFVLLLIVYTYNNNPRFNIDSSIGWIWIYVIPIEKCVRCRSYRTFCFTFLYKYISTIISMWVCDARESFTSFVIVFVMLLFIYWKYISTLIDFQNLLVKKNKLSINAVYNNTEFEIFVKIFSFLEFIRKLRVIVGIFSVTFSFKTVKCPLFILHLCNSNEIVFKLAYWQHHTNLDSWFNLWLWR